MPDAGIGVSLLLGALIFLVIVIVRVVEFLRSKPKGVRWNEEPPRCGSCNRMVIWPDDEPLPWRLTCRECKITRKRQLLWLAIILAIGLPVLLYFTRV